MASKPKTKPETNADDNASGAAKTPEKQQVKVIKLIGQKLDPKAKYLFVINKYEIDMEQMDHTFNKLDSMGINFAVGLSRTNPHEAIAVFEVMPNRDRSTNQ